MAKYLIQNGADVNVQDHLGNTPLLSAVRSLSLTREQYHFRKLLLEHGASVTIKNNVGISPIDVDPMIVNRYKECELSMAYYDDRTAAKLIKPNLSELRAKLKSETASK